MGRLENPVQQKVFKEIGSSKETRIFRNNIGMAWNKKTGTPIRFGVCNPGGSDLIGWTSKTITMDMIGKKVAVFTALETKAPKKKPTPEQENFIAAVKSAGGIAGKVCSVAEAIGLLTKWNK